ncbi:hypothetical protein CQA49_02405 [Helicobacter sp. MIT 00-7814]|uniref:cytochrome P460 family protein n=1 Tax=unclassified Helicobacter TaxID=2593540 RepID=UPI000E1E9667|nr:MULTISPECIES: cytochrome P460 family protein [unclassified Helicobacter]RDU55241.1 hypothetical protein CQA37_04095 [Helicobacter sp. MIT 99-10781]RDU56079.1 hypothetical protein CQA49_02405 [Helicobacter sp. MIT 00-7814]
MKILQYKKNSLCALFVIFILSLCGSVAQNFKGVKNLTFPQDYKNGVLYTSITRGGVIEDIYAQEADILALQKEGKLPELATITMEEYANNNGTHGNLNRYIIMQKHGKQWRFEAFNADKSINVKENTTRCLNCHASAIEGEDIVFTLDSLKKFPLR